MALTYARKALGSEIKIVADGDRLALGQEAASDAEERRRFAQRSQLEHDNGPRLQALLSEQAILSRGLLVGWNASWIDILRSDFDARLRSVGLELVHIYLEEGRPEQAVAAAQEVHLRDPLDEEAVSLLLRSLAESGQFREASETYRIYAKRLAEELNLEPSAATRRLAASIRTGRFSPKATADSGLGDSQTATELFELALKSDPNRVIGLLASRDMSWKTFLKGVDLAPLMMKALEATSEWNADRYRVAIDLIVLAHHQGNTALANYWIDELINGVTPGGREAYVGHAMRAIHNMQCGLFDETRAQLDVCLNLAEALGDPYQMAVVRGNQGNLEMFLGNAARAEQLLLSSIGDLEKDTSEKGIHALSNAYVSLGNNRLSQGDPAGSKSFFELSRSVTVGSSAGTVEIGGAAGYGLALVLLGDKEGWREIAEGTARAYQQRRLPTVLSSLDHAVLAFFHVDRPNIATALLEGIDSQRETLSRPRMPNSQQSIELARRAAISPLADPPDVSAASLLHLVEWACAQMESMTS